MSTPEWWAAIFTAISSAIRSPEWWTAAFTGVLAVTAILALVYAARQLSAAHAGAQVQHLLQLDQRYSQEPMVGYRKQYADKRIRSESEGPFPEVERLLDFFETVALLVNRGYLKDTDVWETFSLDIFSLYADAHDTIEQDRKDDPTEYSNLVPLLNSLQAIEKERGGSAGKPSKEDLAEFWASEASIISGTPSRKRKRSRIRPGWEPTKLPSETKP
jgi:hypothetical protein